MNRYTILTLLALLVLVAALPAYMVREALRMNAAQSTLRQQYVAEAALLYIQNCAECHGTAGDGIGVNPPLNKLGKAEANPELLFQIIARARHGSTMAAWHINEGGIFNDYQINELVTLLQYGDWAQVADQAASRGYIFSPPADLTAEEVLLTVVDREDPHHCAACHEEPEMHADRFGLDCVRCHSLEAWQPALLTRHTFPLDHGEQGTIACETCHIGSYVTYSCYECHDHQPEPMEAVHIAENIPEYENCASCHPTGIPGEAGRLRDGQINLIGSD